MKICVGVVLHKIFLKNAKIVMIENSNIFDDKNKIINI